MDGFNANPDRRKWIGGPQDAPARWRHAAFDQRRPGDPRHLYIGLSGGGVFESADAGGSWQPLNRGTAADFLPDPEAEYGHDPHCLRVHPLTGDAYQQNHCGIYRLDRAARRWERIGAAMPPEAGDIGFPLVLHPRDPKALWVFPMDGGTVWPRMPIGGKPAAYGSRDAGRTWTRLDRGLPRGARLVHREAPGHGGRRARSGRPLLRHHRRRGVGELRRGRRVALPALAPAAHLFGGNRRGCGAPSGRNIAGVKVLLPTPLADYTGHRREVEAEGATLDELFSDLDRRFPGLRFRVIDEQDAIRPHIKVFVNRAQAPVDRGAPRARRRSPRGRGAFRRMMLYH